MHTRKTRKVKRFFVALVATGALAVTSAISAAAGAPSAVPGEPGCLGKDTAGFAQDWKTYSFEPPGVAPLVRFYGGTNPSEWLQGERHEDCAAP